MSIVKRCVLAAALCLVTACGGGGGSGGGNPVGGGAGGGGAGAGSGWTPNVFAPASSFAAQCVAPRSGIDPATGRAYPDRPGTTLSQNNWLRSWTNDLYLWFDEVVDRDPGQFQTPAYFDLLKTNATTPSGQPKDRFHFSMSTEAWRLLSQSGVAAGYGANWTLIASTPPRDIRVAFTEPNSPATSTPVNLARGARVLEVDGVDAVNDNTQAGIDVLNRGLFPTQTNETHTFTIRDAGSSTSRTVTMTSATITSAPVQNVRTIATANGTFGYILFNDHIATAETALINAIFVLNGGDGIDDLVVDMRYNSGGYLIIASQLAYMIAGGNRTANQAFERLRFNSKHPTRNPVTGEQLAPMPFQNAGVGLSAPVGLTLPSLNLRRVFIITGGDTCSASESVINGLRGIGFPIVLMGETTCGKPYGFYPADNCGTTYFSIQFKGENALGFGDYADGFTPATNAQGAAGVSVAGCYASDDFSRELGDPLERRLALALAYDQNGCPAVPTAAVATTPSRTTADSRAALTRPIAMPGKVLGR